MGATCPRCGTKRDPFATDTPASALPRNKTWTPEASTPPTGSRRPTFAPAPARVAPPASWLSDLRFALLEPLGAKGLLLIGFGALLAFAASTPIFVLNIVATVTFFWLYNNFLLKAIRSASDGRDELPDSPMGYEALGFFRLIVTLAATYLALALPLLAGVAIYAWAPGLWPLAVAVGGVGAVWVGYAYPMTLLLVAHTLNPAAAFNYPAIAASIARTFKSYGHVVGFTLLIAAAPHLARLLLLHEELSDGASFALATLESAWAMYAMMATALFLGRFYAREKARLGWFTA